MDESALAKIERRLGKKENNTSKLRRSTFSKESSTIQRAWERPNLTPRPPRRVNWLELGFVGSVVFFVVAAGFAAFLFFSGTNTVSTRNVAIAVDGPTTIRAGEALVLQVAITNRNAVPMELADLIVEFPPGTRAENDISVELPRLRETLGTIEPGESVNRTVRSVVFGSAGTNAEVKVSVEYRVPSSNAIFFGESTYTVPISQSPVSVTIQGLEELVSGQETTFTVRVTSNIEAVLQDMLLVGVYPPGFRFISATPKTFLGENVWRLGDLVPGASRDITVRGSFSGEDGDERVIAFETGAEKQAVEGELAAPLAVGDFTVRLAKPFISASVAFGGTVTTEYIAERGKTIRGDVRYTNNLPTRVQDVQILVTLDGAILDKNQITVDRGFYNSSQNTILWSPQTNPALVDVPPGASGVLSFSIAGLPPGLGTFRNPEARLGVTISGRRVTEMNVPETVQSTSDARVVFTTDLVLQSGLTPAGGVHPPRAEAESVYVVGWTVTNSANGIANASVSAVLPSYVEWQGTADPRVSFNPVGGIVTWTIGEMDAGDTESTSFSVRFTPSLSQVNTNPTLISDQRIYGFDRFTRSQLERIVQPLSAPSRVEP